MLVTISSFGEPYEAHLFRGRLEAEGIPAFVVHDNQIGLRWDLSQAFGGVSVCVPQHQAADARLIAQDCSAGTYREVLRTEVGDLDDLECPHCKSTAFHKHRPLLSSALAVTVSLSMGTVFPPRSWILVCKGCKRAYRLTHRSDLRTAVVLGLAVMAAIYGVWSLLYYWYYVFFRNCPYSDTALTMEVIRRPPRLTSAALSVGYGPFGWFSGDPYGEADNGKNPAQQ